MALVTLPRQLVVDINGDPRIGARLSVYDAGTNNTRVVYTTKAFSVERSQPVESVEGGLFPAIYVNPSGGDFKLVIMDSDGAPIYTEDNIPAQLGATDIDLAGLATASQTTAIIFSFQRSQAEIEAEVTPANYAYAPGERPRYSTLADAVAVSDTHPLRLYSSETITAAITLPDGAQINGFERPEIANSTAGGHVFDATSKAKISIDGVRFKGANATTVPPSGFGGYNAADVGLVNLVSCSDVRITNCEFDTFYNGLTTQNCDRVWITENRSRNFRIHGILASASSQFIIERNIVTDCTQTGAAVAYGIHATGDEAGGNTQQQCSISFNIIDGVASWDGIMAHDVTGLRIVGNDVRNVRQGIDVGHLNATNEVRNIIIADNYVKSTTTNTWATDAASHGGILAAGYDATDRLLGVTIANNIIDGFFATSGMVGGGNPSHIVVSNSDDVTVTGNIVKNGGSVISNGGVYMTGTVNRIAITGNTLQGTMAKGGIRAENVTSDAMAITGNVVKQGTASDNAISFTGSTITTLAVGVNPTNSTAPFAQSTSTIGTGDASQAGSFTGTLTGCTTSPTASIEYSVNGDVVTLEIPALTATSNTTACTVTGMPAAIRPGAAQDAIGITVDNSSSVVSRINIGTGGTLTLYTGTSATFTGSGTKGINSCSFSYRRS